MTLDELKGNNVIDATAGKVETVTPITTGHYASENDPHFSTNDGYRGRPADYNSSMTGRTPTVDKLADYNSSMTGRTPTIDNLEAIPREIKQVQSAPIDMNQLNSFDISTLPKKPEPPNELEDALMGDLSAAVDREIESISERMDAVTEMQRQEMLDELANVEQRNVASIPTDMDTYQDTDYEPETVMQFDDSSIPLGLTSNSNADVIYSDPIINDLTVAPDIDINNKVDIVNAVTVDGESTSIDTFFNETSNEDFDEPNEEVADTFDLLDTIQDDIAKEYGDSLDITEDEDEDSIEVISDEEIVKNLQTEVKKSIGSLKKKFDLSKFKVSDVPMAAAKAVSFSVKDLNTADWALPNSNICITVTGLSGPELISMDPSNSNRNRINTQKDIYSTIYRHIQDPNKGTFEHWMKTTRFSDIQHIYFALYKATFSGSNFIHYECPKCHNIFIQDLDFEDLVEYKDEETAAKIKAIMNGHARHKPYSVTRYQVSDEYVVDIKEPSLWNTVIEITSLSDAFVEKYEDVVDLMSFIHKMYVIDEETMTLIPIDTNAIKGDIGRTTINKIAAYADVIRKISSDNFFALRSKIVSTFDSNEDISYRTPACNCRKCQTMIPEQKREGSELLFMRHQLGALGVM